MGEPKMLATLLRPDVFLSDGTVVPLSYGHHAGTGTCLLVFDSEPNAQSAVEPMTRDGGPQVLDVGVHAVEIEA